MNKKENDSQLDESPPKVIEIEDKEMQVKKPPTNKIVYYKMINGNERSDLDAKRD